MDGVPTIPDTLDSIRQKYQFFNPNGPDGFAAEMQRLLTRLASRREQIESALHHGGDTHTYDEIVALCASGRLMLWYLPNSFMITEIHTFPRIKHHHHFLGGGDLQEIVDTHPDVILMAKALGCSRLTVAGRPGWVKALKAHGWKPYLVTVAKDI
jgi:hypothetical protein